MTSRKWSLLTELKAHINFNYHIVGRQGLKKNSFSVDGRLAAISAAETELNRCQLVAEAVGQRSKAEFACNAAVATSDGDGLTPPSFLTSAQRDAPKVEHTSKSGSSPSKGCSLASSGPSSVRCWTHQGRVPPGLGDGPV